MASSALVQHADTHRRLLQCALEVGARDGIGDGALAHVLERAQVSRDEFRRHFTDAGALWQAVADSLSNELIAAIEHTAGELVDPARRIANGLRMYLHMARDCPAFAKFVAASGLRTAGPASLVHDFLPHHISRGTNTARFADATSETAVDLVAGSTLAALARIAQGSAPADHPERVALAVLKALGVPAREARRLAAAELPPLPHTGSGMLAQARALQA